MIHSILLFVLVNFYYRKKPSPTPGTTSALLAMGWTLPRFFIEFFRGDADRGLYFNNLLSTGQISGGLIFIIALIVFIRLRRSQHVA